MFIAIGLEEAFDPGVVAFARLALGAATLGLITRARTPFRRGTASGCSCSDSSGWSR